MSESEARISHPSAHAEAPAGAMSLTVAPGRLALQAGSKALTALRRLLRSTLQEPLDTARGLCYDKDCRRAEVVELADALRSGRSGHHARVGSNPTFGTSIQEASRPFKPGGLND